MAAGCVLPRPELQYQHIRDSGQNWKVASYGVYLRKREASISVRSAGYSYFM